MPRFPKQDPRMEEAPEPEEAEQQTVPDEHTRLLPNRFDSDRGLLAPDDPAVSPYNLWSIRFLQYLTVGFTFATLVWWTLMLVSSFATPPGFQTRGSGFLAFGFASLTLVNTVLALVFFSVPAKPVRVLVIFMSVSSHDSCSMMRNGF